MSAERREVTERDSVEVVEATVPGLRDNVRIVVALERIETAEQAQWVADVGRGATAAVKTLTDLHAESIAAAHRAHKATIAVRDRVVNLYQPGIDHARRLLKAWDDETRREAERRQREVERDARQRAEAEQLERALQAEEEGDLVAAVEILNTPTPVVAPVVVTAPKPSGFSVRRNWKGRVTDRAAFVRAVIAGTISPEAVCPDLAWLDGQAKRYGSAMNIPGAEVYDAGTGVFR